jgi:hypothetical protein
MISCCKEWGNKKPPVVPTVGASAHHVALRSIYQINAMGCGHNGLNGGNVNLATASHLSTW